MLQGKKYLISMKSLFLDQVSICKAWGEDSSQTLGREGGTPAEDEGKTLLMKTPTNL